MIDEGSCTSLCGGVRQWNGFGPLGEAIDDSEKDDSEKVHTPSYSCPQNHQGDS